MTTIVDAIASLLGTYQFSSEIENNLVEGDYDVVLYADVAFKMAYRIIEVHGSLYERQVLHRRR